MHYLSLEAPTSLIAWFFQLLLTLNVPLKERVSYIIVWFLQCLAVVEQTNSSLDCYSITRECSVIREFSVLHGRAKQNAVYYQKQSSIKSADR